MTGGKRGRVSFFSTRTFFRFNLITGTTLLAASVLGPAAIAAGLPSLSAAIRNEWLENIYLCQAWLYGTVSKVKYDQEEVAEKRTEAHVLNESLNRPINLSNNNLVADLATIKAREQRIVADNAAYITQAYNIPPVGSFGYLHKTYAQRLSELTQQDNKQLELASRYEQLNVDDDKLYEGLLTTYTTLNENISPDQIFDAIFKQLYGVIRFEQTETPAKN